MRSLLWVILAAFVILLDHATKVWLASSFLPGESRIIIPHVLYFTYVQNYHGAFGLFGSHPLLLTALASVVLISFYLWYRREGASQPCTWPSRSSSAVPWATSSIASALATSTTSLICGGGRFSTSPIRPSRSAWRFCFCRCSSTRSALQPGRQVPLGPKH